MIMNLIEIENAHINTNHPDFVGAADSLLNALAGDQEARNQENPFQEDPKNFTIFDKKSPNQEQ